MGRGRQKAKHTKVARQLKYYSPETDYHKLQQELGSNARLEEDLERWSDYAVDDTAPTDHSASNDDAEDVSEDVSTTVNPTADSSDADGAADSDGAADAHSKDATESNDATESEDKAS